MCKMLFFFTYLCRNADPCMTTRNLPCGFLDDLEKNMNPTFCAGILQFDRLNFFLQFKIMQKNFLYFKGLYYVSHKRNQNHTMLF